MDETILNIECAHGIGIASIVCTHHVNSDDKEGFIENSSVPNDLQAWCLQCENVFEKEDGLTDDFRKFNSAVVVCEQCYKSLKLKHQSV